MRLTIKQVDAFTKNPFKGNPAGVITDADGLASEDMLKMAGEMNLAETAFVSMATAPGAMLDGPCWSTQGGAIATPERPPAPATPPGAAWGFRPRRRWALRRLVVARSAPTPVLAAVHRGLGPRRPRYNT